jgi:hypothetical protein
MERPEGYYWIKNKSGFWFVAKWERGKFQLVGSPFEADAENTAEVNEQRILNPDEASGPALEQLKKFEGYPPESFESQMIQMCRAVFPKGFDGMANDQWEVKKKGDMVMVFNQVKPAFYKIYPSTGKIEVWDIDRVHKTFDIPNEMAGR